MSFLTTQSRIVATKGPEPRAIIADTSTGTDCYLCLRSIQADLAREEIVDLPMSGNRRRFSRCAVDEHGMFAAFPQQNASILLKMPDELEPFHAAGSSSVSRITSLPSIDSSERTRLASSTSATASTRLSRASFKLAAWVYWPPEAPQRIRYSPPGPFRTQP